MKSFEIHIYEEPSDEGADARVMLSDSSGSEAAAASLWWNDTPILDGVRIGTIGNYTVVNRDAVKCVLDGAASFLREQGCRIVVGPMNGNTWRGHRFVVESSGRRPFLFEPRNLAEYPDGWEVAGFSVLSRYSSSLIALDGIDLRSNPVRKRLMRSGVVLRSLDSKEYDEELRRIYAISLKSFYNNFLYTSLEEDDFMMSYQKIRDKVDPDFVRIAERDGEPCGFVFGIPDLEAVARGEKPAMIVKTLAVDPAAHCAGLGSWLVEELHCIGREKGYTEAIHALQHETNASLKITGRHHGEVFRRYALFSKLL